MLAAGANNGVTPLFLRQSEIVLAGGALLINVGLFVSFLAFLKVAKLLQLFKKA